MMDFRFWGVCEDKEIFLRKITHHIITTLSHSKEKSILLFKNNFDVSLKIIIILLVK